MDEIYLAIVSRPGQLLAIGLAAVAVVAILIRLRENRHRHVGEQRRGYNCISAEMAWGTSDNAGDGRFKCRRVERITPASPVMPDNPNRIPSVFDTGTEQVYTSAGYHTGSPPHIFSATMAVGGATDKPGVGSSPMATPASSGVSRIVKGDDGPTL